MNGAQSAGNSMNDPTRRPCPELTIPADTLVFQGFGLLSSNRYDGSLWLQNYGGYGSIGETQDCQRMNSQYCHRVSSD